MSSINFVVNIVVCTVINNGVVCDMIIQTNSLVFDNSYSTPKLTRRCQRYQFVNTSSWYRYLLVQHPVELYLYMFLHTQVPVPSAALLGKRAAMLARSHHRIASGGFSQYVQVVPGRV